MLNKSNISFLLVKLGCIIDYKEFQLQFDLSFFRVIV
jgi:hypothetical protein